ncbi:thiamine phosphate synthase [Rummeliibacillus sp. G93]|uniref:thiamine phosphate synthase n=1 Tax=Rummeliibacillus sp. G93 TaxID=2939494 RepID=UPI00273A7124|nr:thiamine phosphate synthase [Rummeliibacillus sp. G93]
MRKEDLAVYLIMGTQNCIEPPLQVLEQALQAGITMFQLREKGEGALTGKDLEMFARECQRLCKQYEIPFIVNDHIELALKIEADGVHIGQEDMELEKIRPEFKGKMIGVSVHTKEELVQAVDQGTDYVGIGPIYETKSKQDAKKPAGVTFLQEARKLYPTLPIVAIGGITVENAQPLKESGADGVAVISAICQSEDCRPVIGSLQSIFKA